MMTSSNGNISRVTGHLCGEFSSPVLGEFPAQRPVKRSFNVFFDLRLIKRLSKQSWGWWLETLSCPLWRHYNAPTSQQRDNNSISLLSYVYQSCQYDFWFLLQYVSEKIGGAKGTELDDEFTEMERVSNLDIVDLYYMSLSTSFPHSCLCVLFVCHQ